MEKIMSIETTVYMNSSILEMLNNAAKITGKSRIYIIALLMQKIMSNNHEKLKFFSRIKYQKRDKKEKWHRLHITLNEYEYEYYLDMRKFLKMSVSFILAYAVRKYVDTVVNKLLDRKIITDNYRYRNYIFIKETFDNEVICWKIYWGIPKELLNKMSSQ